MSKPLIAVTDHALDRLRSRAASVRFADRVTIRLEVFQAIRDGRLASKPPRFLGSDCPATVRRRRKSREPRTVRFAWEPTENAATSFAGNGVAIAGGTSGRSLPSFVPGDDRDTAMRQARLRRAT